MSERIIGIDLGTTNSEVATYRSGQVDVLPVQGQKLLPSCVGLTEDGELLVGAPARNQALLYPERTVASIKRKMGTRDKVSLGGRLHTPQELSALILRELVEAAGREVGEPVGRAVITVPAYFSDAQRAATREAGALAGLTVERILNEPTAASLAYGFGEERPGLTLVYDLGGGTFDVSVVRIEQGVNEVLASHGDNRLGGDDFDELLTNHLLAQFEAKHGCDLRQQGPVPVARLRRAAETAKKTLSFEPYATVREEALAIREGEPLHLEAEISREDYEELIGPLVEKTMASVSRALTEAGVKGRELDAVLLVGGSTRTPLVARLLGERTGVEPRASLDPDLCVAMGAGVLAARLEGREVGAVLVDVSPFSFGPSYLGLRGGVPYPHCYKPVIKKNTPLPVTCAESYVTAVPYQEAVEITVFQGEDEDATRNIPVGDFRVEDLRPVEEPNEILCRMTLDLDGILQVSAIEKATGKARHVSIQNAVRERSHDEVARARARLASLYGFRPEEPAAEPSNLDAEAVGEARELLAQSRDLGGQMHSEDRQEAEEFARRLEAALEREDENELRAATEELRDLLYFVRT